MYLSLSKLASGHFGPYVRNQGLEAELRHLRIVGYVRVPSVRDVPPEGPDLSVHAKVTDAGRTLVALRARVTGGPATGDQEVENLKCDRMPRLSAAEEHRDRRSTRQGASHRRMSRVY